MIYTDEHSGSTLRGEMMERAQLSAARNRLHLSLQEVATHLGVNRATVHRWEKKGGIPQPYHLRKLCELYGVTARELGFSEVVVGEQTADRLQPDILASFRTTYLPLRFLHLVCNWRSARYHELQRILSLELEDNTMDNSLSRRDALRFLALLPLELSGLSPREAVFRSSHEEIVAQCAAGITACWHLRKSKEFAFATDAIAAYIPTLKTIAQTAPTAQRKIAAELLAQCFLLKSTLSRHLDASSAAVAYASYAETYGEAAENATLRVLALRTQAAAHYYENRWTQAIQLAEKAKFLLETSREPIAPLVQSYVYAGLATYQAHNKRKEDALHSLKRAHVTFFQQPTDELPPVWIDHHQPNLVLNDGMTYYHLGLQKNALSSLAQIETIASSSPLISVEAQIDQVLAELARADQPRDMDRCIDLWTRGVSGAKALASQQRMNEAMHAYTMMQAVWPGEKRVKDLYNHLLD